SCKCGKTGSRLVAAICTSAPSTATSWLHEERDLDQPLKVKLLRAPQKQLTLLSNADIRARGLM
ncbi:MAG TPA: hypothetical protein VNZ26_32430, partial [Vicinamibacterales bacterium]|nr:hypothetical protein [Vicinamibacterales bacterium]